MIIPHVYKNIHVGAVLHLCFRQEDGAPFYLDMDLCCPSLTTTNIDSYHGSISSYKIYLVSNRPVGWREELSKLESMISASGYPDVTRSVRMRCISPGVIIPSQVNIKTGLHVKLLAIIFLRLFYFSIQIHLGVRSLMFTAWVRC